MPGFDGTGPLGQGQFTGGGRGYCVMPLDYNNNNKPFSGFAGFKNYQVNIPYPNTQADSSFINPLYPYYPYQLRSTGYSGRPGGYFRGRGGKGMGVRGRRF